VVIRHDQDNKEKIDDLSPERRHVHLRRTLTPLTVANNERYRTLQNVLTKRTFLGATLGATFLKAFLSL